MVDVFISYSRKDQEFVKNLYEAFRRIHRDIWVDWISISPSVDWWREIEAGIEAADSFVFVVSSDSIVSKVCYQEIEHAVKHNKRIIPLVRRKDFDQHQMHPALFTQNWLFFDENDDFNRAFKALIRVIDIN